VLCACVVIYLRVCDYTLACVSLDRLVCVCVCVCVCVRVIKPVRVCDYFLVCL